MYNITKFLVIVYIVNSICKSKIAFYHVKRRSSVFRFSMNQNSVAMVRGEP